MKLTMCKNDGTEGEPKTGGDLVQWRTTMKVFMVSVFENPKDEAHEDEEAEACEPEVQSKGLQEYPCMISQVMF